FRNLHTKSLGNLLTLYFVKPNFTFCSFFHICIFDYEILFSWECLASYSLVYTFCKKIRTEKKLYFILIIIEAFVRESFNRWVRTLELKRLSCTFYVKCPVDVEECEKIRKDRTLIDESQKESEDETEDEELDVSFRISVLKLPIHTLDSLRYAALLRAKEQDYFPTYAQPFSPAHPKPVVKIKDMLMEKRIRREFLATHRAGMKLQALCDVDKYFSEQKKQESSKNKVTAVSMAQKAQERIRITIRENLNNKIYATHKLTARDDEIIQDGLQQLYQDRSSYLEKVRERRAQFLEEKKQKAKDRLLIQNLNNECTLLTRGMTAIDRLKSKQAALKEKSLIVQQKLATEKYQRDLLKQMKEIRAQEIHKRHCEEKFVNDMIAYQKACERLQDARTKVAVVKKNLVTKVPDGMTK
ncbi:hypothetical protein FD754_005770, partial [Muntiacus muntjak]